MNCDAVIFGTGGFAREVYSLLKDMGEDAMGFLAPEAPVDAGLPAPYLGPDAVAQKLCRRGIKKAYLAIGDMKTRKSVYEFAKEVGLQCPPLIHPKAVVLSDVFPDEATIIYPGVLVMTGCRIAKGVLLNAGCTIGHDSVMSDFCNINPGANIAGFVNVGERSMIGIGSCVTEHIFIGAGAIVGAGSVVIRDVPAGAVVYGVPAKEKQHE